MKKMNRFLNPQLLAGFCSARLDDDPADEGEVPTTRSGSRGGRRKVVDPAAESSEQGGDEGRGNAAQPDDASRDDRRERPRNDDRPRDEGRPRYRDDRRERPRNDDRPRYRDDRPRDEQAPAPKLTTCTNCQAINQQIGKHCGECGQKVLAPAKPRCTNTECGAELIPGVKFCNNCGTAVQAPQQVQKPAQQQTAADPNQKWYVLTGGVPQGPFLLEGMQKGLETAAINADTMVHFHPDTQGIGWVKLSEVPCLRKLLPPPPGHESFVPRNPIPPGAPQPPPAPPAPSTPATTFKPLSCSKCSAPRREGARGCPKCGQPYT